MILSKISVWLANFKYWATIQTTLNIFWRWHSLSALKVCRHTHMQKPHWLFFIVDGSLKYHSNSQFISAKGGDIWAACLRLLFWSSCQMFPLKVVHFKEFYACLVFLNVYFLWGCCLFGFGSSGVCVWGGVGLEEWRGVVYFSFLPQKEITSSSPLWLNKPSKSMRSWSWWSLTCAIGLNKPKVCFHIYF